MRQLLVFFLGDERYGLEVDKIQEVVEADELFYVPRAPEHILGAINFHSQVVPVFDLGNFLKLGDQERDHRVVVLAGHELKLALAVTRVVGFQPLQEEALLPESEERRASTYIRAVQNQEDKMINLLDLEGLISAIEETFVDRGGERGA
ncbi:MAG: hypothetical protein C0624_11515 [Desulfuromonas sp.]|nr:MAG: hypothetical protein C0624_11515 [Desulfuromonas sp.]